MNVESEVARDSGQVVQPLLWHWMPQQLSAMTEPVPFCLDPYVVDTLMPDLVDHDRSPSAFIVYLFFARQSAVGDAGSCQASLSRIAEVTGLSRRAVQNAIGLLRRRRLLDVSSVAPTDVPVYTTRQPWRRSSSRVVARVADVLPRKAARTSRRSD